MRIPRCYVVDFETAAIQRRPEYPPKPVGVSIMKPGQRTSRYYAFGHPTENNCGIAEARAALQEAWDSGDYILMHNGLFDRDVAEVHMGMKPLPWHRYHETMFLLFLDDPHAPTLALKPSADRLLGIAPEERDAVVEWLVANIPEVKKKPSTAGAYICRAPGALVGHYANGDVTRTAAIFKKLYPTIVERGMLEAYDRERQLAPILLENERQGVTVDVERMVADRELYGGLIEKSDAWLRKRLKAPDLNIDSDAELADILEREGIITDWVSTATGKRSTAKKNMGPERFTDPRVASVLGYRNRAQTCCSVFYDNWIPMAEATGRIFTHWNQVRTTGGSKDQGARTGRMSSNPNFQNLPKDWYDKNDGYVHPKFLKTFAELPKMRRYIIPDTPDSVFAHADYKSQEYRILAHFEQGALLKAYAADPHADVHRLVMAMIEEVTGVKLERRAVKTLNFAVLYGTGTAAMAELLKVPIEEAMHLRNTWRKAMPDVMSMEKEIRSLGRHNIPIKTWGGRQYLPEPPAEVKGQMRTFEYRLLNYLVQGSAADCTKQALINYDAVKQDGRLLLAVHDECDISVPKKAMLSELRLLREAMQSVPFDVPMLADFEAGPNWAEMEEVKL